MTTMLPPGMKRLPRRTSAASWTLERKRLGRALEAAAELQGDLVAVPRELKQMAGIVKQGLKKTIQNHSILPFARTS